MCKSFGARRLEQAVERLLLKCLTPLGVDAMIEAAKAYKQDNEEERTRWKQSIERARYEVDLARWMDEIRYSLFYLKIVVSGVFPAS